MLVVDMEKFVSPQQGNFIKEDIGATCAMTVGFLFLNDLNVPRNIIHCYVSIIFGTVKNVIG